MSKANVTLVQGLYAAFQRGDIAAIIAALTPDVAWHSHGRPEDYPTLGMRRGPQDVQKFFSTVAENQTATDFSPREYYTDNDKVIVRGHYAWILRKTAKAVSADWVHIFTIKGGKVTTFDEFTDTAQFAGALRG